MDILLPVGLSFYIFQGMSYAIDRYRDTALKPMTFLDVLLFVSFFPVVLSGPIMRSSQFFPQLMEDSPAGSDEEYEQLEKKTYQSGYCRGIQLHFKRSVQKSCAGELFVRTHRARCFSKPGILQLRNRACRHVCLCDADFLRFFGLYGYSHRYRTAHRL